ncbi:L,D-transpeptidase [Frankia sp. Cr2]|uniref:L,D-transpeptidase n=1 Tax=Frankia sp. Cr2 TaxID=3073932 RepID=UPI003A100506
MISSALIGRRRPVSGPAASAISISTDRLPADRRPTRRRMKIALLVVGGMVAFTGCGGGGSKAQPQASATAIPDPVRSQLAAVTAVNADGMNTIVTAAGAVVDIYKSPTAKTASSQLHSPNPAGAPRVFLVVAKLPNWWHVLLPVEPNGSTGWVKASQVKASLTGYHIVVARKDHRLRVYDKTTIVVDEPIAVGTTDTPTPGGHFYVTELLQPRNPAGAYGPYAFGLSGFSTTLDSFDGEDPVIGIHGTNQPNLVGQDVSHGCIRVRNDVITRLAKILPLGTPVEIAA